MKFNFDKLNKIASGAQKQVFEHPTREDMVVARFRSPEAEREIQTERQVKGRFYLTKIIHLLLPTFVPDAHGAYKNKDESVLISERKELDATHRQLNQSRTAFFDGKQQDLRLQDFLDVLLKKSERQARSEHTKRVRGDVRIKTSQQILLALGVLTDPSSINYGYDTEGSPVYVDNTFVPWSIDKKNGVRRMYDSDRIRLALEYMDTSEERRQAQIYFDRLEELFAEEEGAFTHQQ